MKLRAAGVEKFAPWLKKNAAQAQLMAATSRLGAATERLKASAAYRNAEAMPFHARPSEHGAAKAQHRTGGTAFRAGPAMPRGGSAESVWRGGEGVSSPPLPAASAPVCLVSPALPTPLRRDKSLVGPGPGTTFAGREPRRPQFRGAGERPARSGGVQQCSALLNLRGISLTLKALLGWGGEDCSCGLFC